MKSPKYDEAGDVLYIPNPFEELQQFRNVEIDGIVWRFNDWGHFLGLTIIDASTLLERSKPKEPFIHKYYMGLRDCSCHEGKCNYLERRAGMC